MNTTRPVGGNARATPHAGSINPEGGFVSRDCVPSLRSDLDSVGELYPEDDFRAIGCDRVAALPSGEASHSSNS
jgi:hypothetical protein